MFCEEIGPTTNEAAALEIEQSVGVKLAARQGASCGAGWAGWVVGHRVSHSGSSEGSSNGEDGLELHFDDLEFGA